MARIGETLAGLGWDAAALARITVAPDLASAVKDADIVIEAAQEKLELKQAIFAEVERHAPAACAARLQHLGAADRRCHGGRRREASRARHPLVEPALSRSTWSR